MRKATLIPCLIAALVASACGDKRPKTGDANAAEVTTSTPTNPVNPGPVSFESANTDSVVRFPYGDGDLIAGERYARRALRVRPAPLEIVNR